MTRPALTTFLRSLVAVSALIATPGQAAERDPLRVSVDAIQVLDLTADARTVVVGNPEIVDATVVSARRLFLIGKRQGQTNLLVIDRAGAETINTMVQVGPPDAGVVTLNRGVREYQLTCSPRCSQGQQSKDGGKEGGKDSMAPTPAPPEPGGAPKAAP
jgi:hypothetical protein